MDRIRLNRLEQANVDPTVEPIVAFTLFAGLMSYRVRRSPSPDLLDRRVGYDWEIYPARLLKSLQGVIR